MFIYQKGSALLSVADTLSGCDDGRGETTRPGNTDTERKGRPKRDFHSEEVGVIRYGGKKEEECQGQQGKGQGHRQNVSQSVSV